MAQPEFTAPDFVADNTPEDIHERMMANLPYDIDDMAGGFPYDFTMPSAIEKAELIGFHLVRALMIAFPQYAWEGWLDLHGRQVHITRHSAIKASGHLLLEGEAGTVVGAGTVFCVPAAGERRQLNILQMKNVWLAGMELWKWQSLLQRQGRNPM